MTPQGIVAIILAITIPLFYILMAVVDVVHPGSPNDPLVVEVIDDLTKILLGGLLGWISRGDR